MKRSVLLALPLSAAVLTGELYRYVFCRGGSPLLNPLLDAKGHKADYYVHRNSTAEALRLLPQEEWRIRSARGPLLRGYYIPAGGEGKRVAFLIHGYRSEHAETAGMYYEYYRSRGFDLFCCDHTAHGGSEGRLIGFDVYESEDCLLWLDELRRRLGPQITIVLHGFSMGAATVMKMSSRCPENVRFIVEDSGYADALIQLRGQVGPLLPPLRLLNRILAGYDLAQTDVRQSLAGSRLPILFVHGKADRTVPFSNAPLLYDLYQGPKDCLFVDGARHVESMHVAPDAYAKKLDGFLVRYAGGVPVRP